ncbi:MAG: choice-of-anchor R domain-containing protein [Limisphaerales bacterium]
MKYTHKVFCLVASLSAMIIHATAQPVTLFDTLGASMDGSWSSSDGPLCEIFTTDDNNYSLDMITLYMDGSGSVGLTPASAANEIDGPGQEPLALSSEPSGLSWGDYTFTASGITLSPDTSYAVVLTEGPDWEYSNNSGLGSAGIYIDGLGEVPSSNGDYLMQVTATPIPAPEPSTLALMGFGALNLFWFRRRK